MTKTAPLFYKDKPLFGMDIGHGQVRVMQVSYEHAKPRLIGYGSKEFDPNAIDKTGVIIKPEVIATAVQQLFNKQLVGDITTSRVALSLPVSRAFTRSMMVPGLSDKELAEAVRTEAEQYIPATLEELTIDYTRLRGTADDAELFVVAMPNKVISSYLDVTRLLGLEAVLFETSIGGSAQLFSHDKQSDVPSVLIDFGSESADIAVYNGGVSVSGTVACGSEQITQLISKALDITTAEAETIKIKYGLGFSKKQHQIEQAIASPLNLLIKEIKRIIRYYEDRMKDGNTMTQVVISGGGANMPGMADYLTNQLRLAVRTLDPTAYIASGNLQPLTSNDKMSFATTAGLSLIQPHEVFAS